MANSKSSNSEDVLKGGGGGSSAPRAKRPPSPLLAQGESLTPSLPSAQQAQPNPSTPTGETQSNGGSGSVLTGNKGSDMRTYLASLNFGMRMLQRNNLLTFGVVRDANGDALYYEARFDAGKYVLTENDVLALKEDK